MNSDTLFTLIWAPISVVIGIIGGYYIYRQVKRSDEHDANKEHKINKKDKS